MRLIVTIVTVLFLSTGHGQFPYVKKISFPEQLPTQAVYDMLTDSKGYIWLGTDRGLYRFNGRNFIAIPFDNTFSKSVSYLQEDGKGVIWCMNFYNQVFSVQQDTLRRFEIDSVKLKNWSTFSNLVVGTKQLWLQTYTNIYEFDKYTRKILKTIPVGELPDQIFSSVTDENDFFAITQRGFLFSRSKKEKPWRATGNSFFNFKFILRPKGIIGTVTGTGRGPSFEMTNNRFTPLPPINLAPSINIYHGVYINDDEYWLCTQSGAYQWNKKTGETKCYFPDERISDVVKDYQGNYWFSSLDNGVFFCTSLSNSLLKIYNNPLLNNFTRILALPNGEVMTGNTQGLMAKINLVNRQISRYHLAKQTETEFLSYDSVQNLVLSNRGAFKPGRKEPVELFYYSKGVERDKYGNFIIAIFNSSVVINDHFNTLNRFPAINCPLYQAYAKEVVNYDYNHDGKYRALLLRMRRSLSVLSSREKDRFWVGYEDDLYEYHYDGTVKVLKDANGKPVIAKSLQQQLDGSLVVGSTTNGVMVFEEGKIKKTYGDKNGLSSNYVRKVLRQGDDIWVLTEAGLDKVDVKTGFITNYLEEYGLSNTIINDFVISNGKILFATPSGILVRNSLPQSSDFEIKFPLLKATSNGKIIFTDNTLQDKNRDITFYFEALHYLSATALVYQYRLKGLDTVWRSINNFNNQFAFSRLSPGKYHFEIKAVAGPNYKSAVRSFSFTVPRPYWQKAGFLILSFTLLILVCLLFLRQWKKSLLRRQKIKEQLLKSQLVALRSQMNPHFLYNVLNTVQGLVYGNRKTEAGELLGNFSDLMRKTLEGSDKQLLPLKDEIENLRLYLELEKARFDEGFSYKIDTTNIDNLSSIYIPSLMLQPFAENSVKHGLMHKQGNKKVEIFFEKQADGLTVIIDDNGIGRLHSMEINQRSHNKPFSFATVALNERMNLFNHLYKQKITCQIIDKIDERQESLGTRIELFIPDYSNDPHAL
ncbi:MAG: histidine kinase [Bacteroidota bacterium]